MSLFGAAVALLSGCGSSKPAVPVTLPNLTGNWQMQAAGAPPNLGLILAGSLENQGSVVTGTMLLSDLNLPNPCGISTPIALTGTLSFAQGIQLQSQPFNGSVVNVSLELSATENALLTGTIGITGPLCNYPESPAVGAQIASLTGNFGGSVGSSNALQSQTVVLDLTQNATPTSSGEFPVNGTLQVSGSFCNGTYALSGFANGTYLNLAAPVSTSPGAASAAGPPPATVIGYSDTAAKQLSDTQIVFSAGPCSTGLTSYDTYTGTLTRQ